MNLKTLTTIAATLSVASLSCVVAQSITNFGTNTFTVESSTTSGFVQSQSANDISLSGSDLGSELWGTFAVIDLSLNWGNDLAIAGNASVAPTSLFSIDLYDNDGDFATFNGGSWSDLSGGGQSSLSLSGTTLTGGGTFDNTQIFLLTLKTGGAGDTITTDLSGLSVVPEPSAFALIAGCFGFAWVMVRRRV